MSLAHLPTSSERLTDQIGLLQSRFGRKSHVARQVTDRLRKAHEDIALLTPSSLYQYVEPASTQRSFELEQTHGVSNLVLARNLFFAAPVFLTLIILAWAFTQYQAGIALHPQDINQPFLILWETGFGGGSNLLAASHIAIADAGFFFLGIVVGLNGEFLRIRARNRAESFRVELENALGLLYNLSLEKMRELANPNVNQNQVLMQVNVALQQSVQITQQVQVQIVEVAREMGTFQKSTSSLTESTSAFGERLLNFLDQSSQLIEDIRQFTQGTRQLQQEQQQVVIGIRDLSNRMLQSNTQISSLAESLNKALDQLGSQFAASARTMSQAEANLARVGNTLGETGRSLVEGNGALVRLTENLTSSLEQVKGVNTQLEASTVRLTFSQEGVRQELNEVVRYVGHLANRSDISTTALEKLASSQASSVQASADLVVRLERTEQLAQQLERLNENGTRGSSLTPVFSISNLQNGEQKPDPLDVLSRLRKGAQSLQSLKSALNLEAVLFLEIISRYKAMGLISLEGKSGNEKVKLTPKGEQLLNL